MAYVAISTQLRSDVAHAVSRLKDNEIATLKRPQPLNFTILPPEAMALVWGEYLHLKDVIPDEWKRKGNDVVFTYRGERENGDRISASARIDTLEKFFAPPGFNSYVTLDTMEGNPYIAPFWEYEVQAHDIKMRWNKVRDEVSAFLLKCKSLNEALKLWPDIKHYIPADYMERVNKKSEKAAAKESEAMEFLKNMDTDGALAALVMARMATAGAQQ